MGLARSMTINRRFARSADGWPVASKARLGENGGRQAHPKPKACMPKKIQQNGVVSKPDEPSPVEWTSVEAMRPTQCAVGYIEVALKMRELSARGSDPKALKKYLKGHPIPAVLGPDGRMYLTDHHHMGLALCRLSERWDAGDGGAGLNPFRMCCFNVQADFSNQPQMSLKGFYAAMEARGLCHPYDGQGLRSKAPPSSLDQLQDDPYRALAGLARKAGAFDKAPMAYAEFKWADFLRDKIPVGWIAPAKLADAIHEACLLARSSLAKGLPGFKGPLGPNEQPASIQSIQARLVTKFGAADEDAPSLAAEMDVFGAKLQGWRSTVATPLHQAIKSKALAS